MTDSSQRELYPPVEPFETGRLEREPPHDLYWEQSGRPDGQPVVFLHGGPGAGASPEHRRFFDPTKAKVITANSKIVVEKPSAVQGKRVIVVEDGPTLTHGGMAYGAGYFAAKTYGCTLVDPRKHAVGSLKDMYKKFKRLGKVLPAMGYSEEQRKELQQTINKANCDAVIIATPIDLGKLLKLNKPSTRVRYYLEEIGKPKIIDLLKGAKCI